MGNICFKCNNANTRQVNIRRLLFDKSALDKYQVRKYINKGAYGKVYGVKNKINGQNYVLKEVNKIMSFKNEYNYFKLNIKHKNLIVYNEFISLNNKKFYIIMNKYDFDLCDLLNKSKYLTEDKVKNYIHQILLGLKELENYDYYHLDIKLENILLDKKSNNLVISDFGCMHNIESDYYCKNVTNSIGTKMYNAPEISCFGLFCRNTDVWSIGLLTYILLNKLKIPENVFTEKDILNNIIYDCNMLSNNCLNFLDLTIEPNYKKRFSLDDCLDHKWINETIII